MYTLYILVVDGDDYMELRIQKWGNSCGIRIPSNVLKSLDIKVNDVLNMDVEGKKIIISVPKKNKISLYNKFKNYNGENLAKDFSWDDSVGREIW